MNTHLYIYFVENTCLKKYHTYMPTFCILVGVIFDFLYKNKKHYILKIQCQFYTFSRFIFNSAELYPQTSCRVWRYFECTHITPSRLCAPSFLILARAENRVLSILFLSTLVFGHIRILWFLLLKICWYLAPMIIVENFIYIVLYYFYNCHISSMWNYDWFLNLHKDFQ